MRCIAITGLVLLFAGTAMAAGPELAPLQRGPGQRAAQKPSNLQKGAGLQKPGAMQRGPVRPLQKPLQRGGGGLNAMQKPSQKPSQKDKGPAASQKPSSSKDKSPVQGNPGQRKPLPGSKKPSPSLPGAESTDQVYLDSEESLVTGASTLEFAPLPGVDAT